MSGEESSHLVQTVLATHRRCASEGNSFDVNRVLVTLGEHNAIISSNADQSEGADKETYHCDSKSDAKSISEKMSNEASDAAFLLSNITNLKNCGENKLKEMLLQTQEELNLRNGEILKMSKLKEKITEELAELTACLFEEANRMVNDANRSRYSAIKQLEENEMALTMLQAEVKMLKHAAHSRPYDMGTRRLGNNKNTCARSQSAASSIISSSNSQSSSRGSNIDKKGADKKEAALRRTEKKSKASANGSTVCFSSRGNSATIEPNMHHSHTFSDSSQLQSTLTQDGENDLLEVCRETSNLDHLDMKCFNEFLLWRQNPQLRSTAEENGSEFYEHILTNDIRPCLAFCTDEEMHTRLLKACEANLVSIEKLSSSSNSACLSSCNNNDNSVAPCVSSASPSSSESSNTSDHNCNSNNTNAQARHCQLSQVMRVCEYKVWIEDAPQSEDPGPSQSEKQHNCFIVCKTVRDRIAAVCELLTFLRHVSLNLYTKTESIDLFLRLTHLQAVCCLTRLGFLT